MKKKSGFRKTINYIHLWIGVPSALILFVVCLSGSLYVFQEDISRWIDKDKYAVLQPLNTQPLSIETLKSRVEEQQKGHVVTAVQIPASADEAWIITLKKPEQPGAGKAQSKEKSRGQSFIVNPYTGKIVNTTQTASYKFFNWVMRLHRWLLMDKETGKYITGIAAFMFLLLEITGIMLWVPRKLKTWSNWKAWKPGFVVRREAGWKRKNFDLHKAVGFYTFIFITIMAITGPYFGFDWYKQGVNNALGVKTQKKDEKKDDKKVEKKHLAKHAADSAQALPMKALLHKVDSIYPYTAVTRINFPENGSGPINIMKVRKGFTEASLPDRVTLNAFTGAVVKTERFADKKLGEKIAASMKSIHTGELFGGYTKIIWFVACLMATSMPVTGVIIWLNKRPTSKKRASPSPTSQHRVSRLQAAGS
jgi:uncharacterized iron-regulated membrane protein